MYDAIIIGAGVVGCAIAQQMAKYNGKLLVVDRMEDVADGASKANSGIVHAGFDAHPGTEKARLNVKGSMMYGDLAKELGVPYTQPGALVLGFSEEDRATLNNLARHRRRPTTCPAAALWSTMKFCRWSLTPTLRLCAPCMRPPAPWSARMR